MKTTRDQLKSLIKEILLEVLTEGLGGTTRSMPEQMPGLKTARTNRVVGRPKFDPSLDTPVINRQQAALEETIKRQSGGNSVMASILADTAKTTLPTMMSHGDGVHGAAPPQQVQQEQFAGDPIEVFGDSASRWADLAFMPPGKKTA